MAKQQKLGSAKRFNARYGKRVKDKFAKIESMQKMNHKCPYCHAEKVRRKALGIWECKKCETKFTGKAYTITKKVGAE